MTAVVPKFLFMETHFKNCLLNYGVCMLFKFSSIFIQIPDHFIHHSFDSPFSVKVGH